MAGHEVYDFRNPAEGDNGFGWAQIGHSNGEGAGARVNAGELVKLLEHKRAHHSFHLDMGGLIDCEACVMLAPCGNSAHLEAGWARGNGKPLIVFVPAAVSIQPELMYLMADHLVASVPELLELLEATKAAERIS